MSPAILSLYAKKGDCFSISSNPGYAKAELAGPTYAQLGPSALQSALVHLTMESPLHDPCPLCYLYIKAGKQGDHSRIRRQGHRRPRGSRISFDDPAQRHVQDSTHCEARARQLCHETHKARWDALQDT
jgi:hypothetical protein